MREVKKVGLPGILSDLEKGLSQKDISEKYNIPKQTVSYSVGKLITLKCVEKIGSGINSSYKVLNLVPIRPKDTSRVKVGLREIRGHAFIWNIEFLEEGYNWKQIIINYKKKYPKSTLNFKMICNGKVPRTIFKQRKIWLTKSGLTIYEPLDFFGKSSFTVKGTAVFEMDRLIKDLLKKLNLNLQHYRFKCSREHFAHVKNEMARQFNDSKQKIYVEFDGKHFWIDHSHGENEAETDNANVSVQAQKYYKSQMETDFKVTPEVILDNFKESANQIKKNAENLDYHAENMRSHVGATQDLSLATKKLNSNLDKQTEFLNQLVILLKNKL